MVKNELNNTKLRSEMYMGTEVPTVHRQQSLVTLIAVNELSHCSESMVVMISK